MKHAGWGRRRKNRTERRVLVPSRFYRRLQRSIKSMRAVNSLMRAWRFQNKTTIGSTARTRSAVFLDLTKRIIFLGNIGRTLRCTWNTRAVTNLKLCRFLFVHRPIHRATKRNSQPILIRIQKNREPQQLSSKQRRENDERSKNKAKLKISWLNYKT